MLLKSFGFILFVAVLALTQRPGQVLAATVTWDGGGADNNWMTPQNWQGDLAPNPGDTLVFPAPAAQQATYNNFPAGTAFGIQFTGSAGGYNLSGNRVHLTGSLGISATNL